MTITVQHRMMLTLLQGR